MSRAGTQAGRGRRTFRDIDNFRTSEGVELPNIAIGRYVLPKVQAVGQSRHPMEAYIDKLAKANRGRGTVIEPEDLFLAYIGPDTYLKAIIEGHLGNAIATAGKIKSAMSRVKRNIADELYEAQRLDGEKRLATLPEHTAEAQGLEPDEAVLCTNESDDPGPFDMWGVIDIQLRSQPELVGDHIVAARGYVHELEPSYLGLKAVLAREGSLNSHALMDFNRWEPLIPVFVSDDRISRESFEAITFPRPPMHITLQELKIVEL